MGEVFRATDEQLGRLVAVKLLLPSQDPDAGERFHREAQAAAKLSDPHVVSVYDFGRHGDGFFLVMELVEGRTVAEELAQRGPLPKDRAIDIIEQAAAGLAAAHRVDVVHRDVKPRNLLLTADGLVKVADFGIAHLPADEATTLTATGQIIGSAHYLAPERASGGRAVKASDVYSLGCVLYQLVTGQPPFVADHPTAILYQHVDAAPAPPSLLRPELGGPFEDMLLRMLAKDAADRPSAAEIAAGALRVEPLGDTFSAARMPSNTLLAGLVAALATVAAVMAGVLLYGSETKQPPTTDIDPAPGIRSSTPKTDAPESQTTTGRTQPGSVDRPTTSTQPSQSASSQPTPSTASPSSTSPGATPSRTPTQSSTPTQRTPSTAPSPASTPPPQSASTATPLTATPSTVTPSTFTSSTRTPATGTPATPASDSATGLLLPR